jgi:hypothetical protein
MPQWLIALAIESAQKPVSQTLASGEVFTPGTRNDALFRIASFMCSGNMSEGMILGALRAANDERCDPPLDDVEVKRIAANAVRLYRHKATINVIAQPIDHFNHVVAVPALQGISSLGVLDASYRDGMVASGEGEPSEVRLQALANLSCPIDNPVTVSRAEVC